MITVLTDLYRIRDYLITMIKEASFIASSSTNTLMFEMYLLFCHSVRLSFLYLWTGLNSMNKCMEYWSTPPQDKGIEA